MVLDRKSLVTNIDYSKPSIVSAVRLSTAFAISAHGWGDVVEARSLRVLGEAKVFVHMNRILSSLSVLLAWQSCIMTVNDAKPQMIFSKELVGSEATRGGTSNTSA